ncbi:putative AbiEii toxin of type IV toxin-antitoxin system [Pantoea sp. AG1095]|uniref:ATP-dependent nuclease n=1 Tax=Pantoea sp. AG1095 TaxID=2184004 RepID=UPI000D822474|nr:AAA family ATPase [Pantoea sp. AG1095]PYG48739.1 putative AbiEii toxin of type IV toxin-antitoxin system [Pantoea sp. AG1095]
MLERLLFNAGSNPASSVPLSVDLTPLTIFVGPNNSGKSRALIEIETQLKAHHFTKGHVINQVFIKKTPRDVAIRELKELEIKPQADERVYDGHIIISRLNIQNGGLSRLNIPLSNILSEFENPNANNKNYLNQYYAMFTLRLDGRSRLSLTSDQGAGDLQSAPSNNLMYLFKNDDLRAELRNIIYSAFDKYFVIDPTNIGMLRIRLSQEPPENDKVERGWDEESVDFHSKARLISEFSDGVNAFTGMMISLIAGSPKVTLIDEPEAFLHPSLCSKLGKEISRVCAHSNKNVFISTHSANFLMGCVQSKVPMNIVRLTYDGTQGTSRLLTKEQLTPLMRNPLLRSIGVLNALFYNFVIVTEADADRAFYQEINERLLAAGDPRGIEGCLFLNAQNKQTVWDIIKPLRELGIPSVGIVDIDVLKEGGAVWKKPMDGAYIPVIRHEPMNNQRAALLKAFNETGLNMKTQGGINILSKEQKEACGDFFNSLSDYGVFIVPCGEIESWLTKLDICRNKGSWLTNIFERMGDDPSEASYVSPTDDDVWDFIGAIKEWLSNPSRKGIPL